MSEKTLTAEQANNTILDATFRVLGDHPDTSLNNIPPGGISKPPYAIREMDRNPQFVEFVLGNTQTNKIVTFFRKYTGSDNWTIFVYANDKDAREKNAVETDLRTYIDPNNVATPGKVKIPRIGDSTHDLSQLFAQLAERRREFGGRRRRRTRARKTRRRKTRR